MRCILESLAQLNAEEPHEREGLRHRVGQHLPMRTHQSKVGALVPWRNPHSQREIGRGITQPNLQLFAEYFIVSRYFYVLNCLLRQKVSLFPNNHRVCLRCNVLASPTAMLHVSLKSWNCPSKVTMAGSIIWAEGDVDQSLVIYLRSNSIKHWKYYAH